MQYKKKDNKKRKKKSIFQNAMRSESAGELLQQKTSKCKKKKNKVKTKKKQCKTRKNNNSPKNYQL